MDDDFISIKEVVDSDGIGYCLDKYLHSEQLNNEYFATLVEEVQNLMQTIEDYISTQAIKQTMEENNEEYSEEYDEV